MCGPTWHKQLRQPLLALCLLLAFSQTYTADDDHSLVDLMKSGIVRVADTQACPPWSYLGPDNQPTGYDVAAAREIFKRIGVPNVVLIVDNFKNLVDFFAGNSPRVRQFLSLTDA